MPLEKILEKALYYDGAFYLLHLIFCLRLGGAFVFSHFHHRKLFYHNGGAGSIENGVCPPRKMMWFLPNIAQGGNRGPRKAQAQKAPRRGGDSPPAHNPSVSFADSSPYTGEPCVFAEMTLFRRAADSSPYAMFVETTPFFNRRLRTEWYEFRRSGRAKRFACRRGFSGAKKEGRCWRPSSFGCFKFILSRVEVKLLRAAGICKTCDILYSFE